MFVIFLCTLQTNVYHLEYIVSNMTKKYLIRRIPPKSYSYTRMTDNSIAINKFLIYIVLAIVLYLLLTYLLPMSSKHGYQYLCCFLNSCSP